MARPTSGEATRTERPGQAWAATMERLRGRPLPVQRLRICDDEDLRRRLAEAEQAAERAAFLAEAAPDDEALAARTTKARHALEAVRAEWESASIVLTFRALPGPLLEELLTAHPPTDAQTQEGAAFNPDTFAPVLIAASCTDGMSETDAAELLESWSAPDRNALWEAAWQVQQQSRVDVGKG